MDLEREAQEMENPQQKPTQNPPRTQWRLRKELQPILSAGENIYPQRCGIFRKPRT
jgi:hypothetical protein